MGMENEDPAEQLSPLRQLSIALDRGERNGGCIRPRGPREQGQTQTADDWSVRNNDILKRNNVILPPDGGASLGLDSVRFGT